MYITYNHLTIGVILILSFLLSLTVGEEIKKERCSKISRSKKNNPNGGNGNDNNIIKVNQDDKHFDIKIKTDLVNKINSNQDPNNEGFSNFITDKLKYFTNSLKEGIDANNKIELQVKKVKKQKLQDSFKDIKNSKIVKKRVREI